MIHNSIRSPAAAWRFATAAPWLLACICTLWGPGARAATLLGVEAAPTPEGGVQVQVRASEPVAQPLTFMINDPPRLVLDFAGVRNQIPARSTEIKLGAAESVTALQVGDRTRLVINLTSAQPYRATVEGSTVLVDIGASTVQADADNVPSTPDAGTVRAMSAGGTQPAVRGARVTNVDFRRGDQGQGRVIISLSDPNIAVSARSEGTRILVDLRGAGLSQALSRKLDVNDFATPVRSIETRDRSDRVRVDIDINGPFEYLAYQTGNDYTVEVSPVTPEALSARRDRKSYTGEPISLNFQNIEVRAVLQLLADFTGKNLVASDTVSGTVTLRLQNVPWDQALDIILSAKGLAKREEGTVMWVAPAEEIAARERLELETRQQLRELAPLYTEYLQVNYAKAKEVADLLTAETNKILTERGNVAVDERTNTLIVNDTEAKIDDIKALLKVLDVPVRQVLIESRIVNATVNFAKNLGVRFGASRSREQGQYGTGIAGNLNGASQLANGTTPALNDRLNVNMGALPLEGVPFAPSSIALAIAKLPFGRLLDLELSALQTNGEGEVLSNPRVVTANQREAVISRGTEIPYQRASASGATAIQFKDAVLSLKVTPQITPDNKVIMDVTVTNDTVDFSQSVGTGAEPPINTQEVTTQVLVGNGETLVIGGIYEHSKDHTLVRTPFFGNLPYIGRLFRNTQNATGRSELLVFITPKILEEGLAAF